MICSVVDGFFNVQLKCLSPKCPGNSPFIFMVHASPFCSLDGMGDADNSSLGGMLVFWRRV